MSALETEHDGIEYTLIGVPDPKLDNDCKGCVADGEGNPPCAKMPVCVVDSDPVNINRIWVEK